MKNGGQVECMKYRGDQHNTEQNASYLCFTKRVGGQGANSNKFKEI